MTAYRARTKPWYALARWKRKRARQLATEPLCRFCLDHGKVTAASIADHITPHKGNEDLFWNGELQSLCKRCHDKDKQQLERTGKRPAQYGTDGWPT